MDSVLCDELLIEIFQRLPGSSSAAISLVSKRWLHLRRHSTTTLALLVPPPPSISIPLFLSLHPFISSLAFFTFTGDTLAGDTPTFDPLLLSAAASTPTTLTTLRFYPGPIASISTLISLASFKPHLLSLKISLYRTTHLDFTFLTHFTSLSDFSVSISDSEDAAPQFSTHQPPEQSATLGVQSLTVTGIGDEDVGFGWLWRSLGRLRRLQMRSCQGVGDKGDALASFRNCVRGVEELELKRCRSIVNAVLLRLGENCDMLKSLLIYDGGSREGLLDFIVNCKSNLERIGLRLPLDLNDHHLYAIAARFPSLKVFEIRSSYMVTGEGMKNMSLSMGKSLEELTLMSCDFVEKVPGLLTTLGQNLRQLKKLDLSYNEMPNEKEFISMLASSNRLNELILRGNNWVTPASIVCMIRSCKRLESLDIMQCPRLEKETIELILCNFRWLRLMAVEQYKVSDAATRLASIKLVQLVNCSWKSSM